MVLLAGIGRLAPGAGTGAVEPAPDRPWAAHSVLDTPLLFFLITAAVGVWTAYSKSEVYRHVASGCS